MGTQLIQELKVALEHFGAHRETFRGYTYLNDEGIKPYKQILRLAAKAFPDHENYFAAEANFYQSYEVKLKKLDTVFDYIKRLIKTAEERAQRERAQAPETRVRGYEVELGKIKQENVTLKADKKLLTEQLTVMQKSLTKILEGKPFSRLFDLLEKARPLKIDENWVSAICALNLLEISVNKKLEDLGNSTEGSFNTRYERLTAACKAKEKRDIRRLLPTPLYNARSKMDHAGHKYKPTPQETEMIVKYVSDFISELFREKT